ncbi:MAG: hypothetical protein IPJ16_11410 [Bacteroidales bacterium]|nr:hypothetical protein [Bacteroidales bacterium]
MNDKNLTPISIDEYNTYFNTSILKFEDKKQYYFSATPNLCLYLIEKYPGINILLYLDADVYVYDSLNSLYEEFSDSSVGFCSHRLHPIIDLFTRSYGKYNVGVNLFRNSETGLKCLRDWKSDCDSWYPEIPGYKLKFFSDQIFLDSWPERYEGVKIIENIGVNVCHWNATNYKFTKQNERYFVNGEPLIIYHFSSLRKESDTIWNAGSIYAFVSIKKVLLEIYTEYVKLLESFGLDNMKMEKMTHKESLRKRVFHSVMKFFINEKIDLKSDK